MNHTSEKPKTAMDAQDFVELFRAELDELDDSADADNTADTEMTGVRTSAQEAEFLAFFRKELSRGSK